MIDPQVTVSDQGHSCRKRMREGLLRCYQTPRSRHQARQQGTDTLENEYKRKRKYLRSTRDAYLSQSTHIRKNNQLWRSRGCEGINQRFLEQSRGTVHGLPTKHDNSTIRITKCSIHRLVELKGCNAAAFPEYEPLLRITNNRGRKGSVSRFGAKSKFLNQCDNNFSRGLK